MFTTNISLMHGRNYEYPIHSNVLMISVVDFRYNKSLS